MKILITGGSGFIGSNLADQFLPEGHELLIIDNFATGRRDNLTPRPKLKLVEGSIVDEDFLAEAFEKFKPDIVIHAAASYKDPENWEEDTLTNVLGTAYVVKNSIKNKIRRLIYFQTSLCYGKSKIQPLTIESPVLPESSYAITKTAAERYIALSGLDFISFRLANVFGPRNLSGPVPTFYKRLNEGKKCFVVDTRRDFLFIKDLVAIVSKAVNGEGRKGFYHISNGRDYSIHDLYQEVVRAMKLTNLEPVEIKPRSPDDVETLLLDPSKTHQEFGWKTRWGLSEGIDQAVSWYRAHGVEQTFTHLTGMDAKK